MIKDILEGQWDQKRGNAKTWWGKFTDDDLDMVAGNNDALAVCFMKNLAHPVERGRGNR